jgi:MFS family permease
MVLGSIAYAVRPRVGLLTVFVVSTALIGIGYAGIGLAPSLAVACAFSVIGGLGNGAQWIVFVTAIQQSVSPAAQNSVMSVVEAINKMAPAIGFLLGGAIATLFSPRAAYAAAAGGVLVVLLLIALRPPEGLVQRAHVAPEDKTEEQEEEPALAVGARPSP